MAIRDEVLPVGPPVQLEWQIGRIADIEHQLSPISSADRRQGLVRAFDTLGCPLADTAIDVILEESEGHPQRTMLVAREAHRLAESAGAARVTTGHVVVGAAAARDQHLWGPGEA